MSRCAVDDPTVFKVKSPAPEDAYVLESGLEGDKSLVEDVIPLSKLTPEHGFQREI